MSTVHITLNAAQARDANGTGLPIVNSRPLDAETVTSSGASAEVTGIVGQAGKVWQVVSTGNLHVQFSPAGGSDTTAGADIGHLVLAGERFDCLCQSDGERVFIKDVA